jgi:ABC-2 type transport system permease protein
MKRFAILLQKEVRELLRARATPLYFLLVSGLLGYSFYSAVSLYGTASTAALENPLYATGFEPVPGVFTPLFGGLFLLESLFLPFLVIPLIALERSRNTFIVLLQLPWSVEAILAAKFLAALLLVLLATAMTIPSLILWTAWGGHLPGAELLLLASGHFLYGTVVVAVSLGAASLWGSAASASIGALAAIIASWFIDFGRDMHIGPLFDSIAPWSLTKTVKTFEDGLLATDAVSYLILLALGCLLAARVLLHPDVRRKAYAMVLLVAVGAGMLTAANRWSSTLDLTESGRNSFPARYQRILRVAPDPEIEIGLERTDSRAKDFEKSFLKRLSVAAPKARVRWMTGERLRDNYGQFVYRVGGREERTFSNSEEEIFIILAALAGEPAPDLTEGDLYPGYPLVTSDAQQSLALLVYLLGVPLLIMSLIFVKRFYRNRKAVSHEI